jgi:hypothetical protein
MQALFQRREGERRGYPFLHDNVALAFAPKQSTPLRVSPTQRISKTIPYRHKGLGRGIMARKSLVKPLRQEITERFDRARRKTVHR